MNIGDNKLPVNIKMNSTLSEKLTVILTFFTLIHESTLTGKNMLFEEHIFHRSIFFFHLRTDPHLEGVSSENSEICLPVSRQHSSCLSVTLFSVSARGV